MHGLKTMARLNADNAKAEEIVEKHNGVTHAPATPRRDFLIGHYHENDISIVTPLTSKAIQWAYTNIREHLGREGIAYVVHAEAGALLESQIRNNGFGVN